MKLIARFVIRTYVNLENQAMKQLSRIPVFLAAVALTAMAGCSANPPQESTGQYIDDSVITAKVKSAIFNAPSLKSYEINVDTFKGRVQLSGSVSSRANIDEAVAIAHRVNGVTSVQNDMLLK
jgi:osmotically-inducible protein OsmY